MSADLNAEDITALLAIVDPLYRLRTSEGPTDGQARAELRRKTNSIHLCLQRVESFVVVSIFALNEQSADVDGDVANVLQAAVSKLHEVNDSLESAFDLLPQLSAQRDLRSSLAVIRAKLCVMQVVP